VKADGLAIHVFGEAAVVVARQALSRFVGRGWFRLLRSKRSYRKDQDARQELGGSHYDSQDESR
jgi:hypothetical protein